MKGNIFKGIWKAVVVVLIIALSRPIFYSIGKYYLKSPTIVIIAVIGIIVVVYLIVFFKEIFRRRKS